MTEVGTGGLDLIIEADRYRCVLPEGRARD
jgi:hypothetical protein